MPRFTLSNLLLALVPLGAGFWSVGELFRPHRLAVLIMLVALMCAMLAATVGAIVNGRQGLLRGLVMGATAIVFVGVGAVACVAVIMALLTVAASFAPT